MTIKQSMSTKNRDFVKNKNKKCWNHSFFLSTGQEQENKVQSRHIYLVVISEVTVELGSEVVWKTRSVKSGKKDEMVDEAGGVAMMGGVMVFIR